jgi:hypothetical protein
VGSLAVFFLPKCADAQCLSLIICKEAFPF